MVRRINKRNLVLARYSLVRSLKAIKMVSVIFDFKTNTNKNLEFIQAIGSTIVDLRNVKGHTFV